LKFKKIVLGVIVLFSFFEKKMVKLEVKIFFEK